MSLKGRGRDEEGGGQCSHRVWLESLGRGWRGVQEIASTTWSKRESCDKAGEVCVGGQSGESFKCQTEERCGQACTFRKSILTVLWEMDWGRERLEAGRPMSLSKKAEGVWMERKADESSLVGAGLFLALDNVLFICFVFLLPLFLNLSFHSCSCGIN